MAQERVAVRQGRLRGGGVPPPDGRGEVAAEIREAARRVSPAAPSRLAEQAADAARELADDHRVDGAVGGGRQDEAQPELVLRQRLDVPPGGVGARRRATRPSSSPEARRTSCSTTQRS